MHAPTSAPGVAQLPAPDRCETPKHLDVHLNYATHKGAGPVHDTLATYTDDPDANTKAKVFCFVAAPTGSAGR